MLAVGQWVYCQVCGARTLPSVARRIFREGKCWACRHPERAGEHRAIRVTLLRAVVHWRREERGEVGLASRTQEELTGCRQGWEDRA
jgi:hypothetical protein